MRLRSPHPAAPRAPWLRALPIALLALLLVPSWSPAGPAPEVHWPDRGDDLLVVRPAPGIPLATLADAVTAAGYDAAPRPAIAALRVRVAEGADAVAVARRLVASGLVGSIEPDAIVAAGRTPDDPIYPRQAEYLAATGATLAWDRSVGLPELVLAVIDTGLDADHPDLRGRVALNAAEATPNGRDDDGNGCVDDRAGCSFVSLETADPTCGYEDAPPHAGTEDDEGHGSFVAGIAAAAGNNGTGLAGVAWNVRILPVKVLDCTATGRISDAAAGVRYAVARGAEVINISFGSRTDSPVLRDAIVAALDEGVTVVASAGNDGSDLVTYPARYGGVLAVAASGRVVDSAVDYQMPSVFSNFGSGVDLLAPGLFLYSTVPPEACGRRGWFCIDGGTPYAVASGTSFAAPIVAGAAALVRSAHPGLRGPMVRARLLSTARDVPGPTDLLRIDRAVSAPLFAVGIPGTSRDGPLALPPGPADRPVGLREPTPVPPVVPRPAETGQGARAPRAAHPSTARRRRASLRIS